MEEILASIRRIIADDHDPARSGFPGPVKPESAFMPAQPKLDGTQAITEAMPPVEPPPSSPVKEQGREDAEDASETVDFDAADLEEPAEPEAPPAEEMNVDMEPDVVQNHDPEPLAEDHLLSRTTDHSVSHAFNMLTHTVLTHNARTLEDLVKDMLRPMLKNWLDENLPTIVERLVRSEIERVARGSR